jgi:hypothetical protein
MLELIRSHIASAGYHVTLVQGGQNPRFAYSVGLTEAGLPELVLAGASSLSAEQVHRALDVLTLAVKNGHAQPAAELVVERVGAFELVPVDRTWTRHLLLGALHYYDRGDVPALQIMPEESLRTIDVPDLSAPYDPDDQPVWRWLTQEWPFAIPSDATVMTNLDALQGYAITEAARWEEGYWEAFSGSGPDTPMDEHRAVPLATLLGFDATLEPLVHLEVNDAIIRDDVGDPWRVWGKSTS